MNVEDFFDEEFPDDASGGVYRRLRNDPRTPTAIACLQKLGFNDQYIRIVFRLVSLIPHDWASEKEAPHIATRRRKELAEKLWKLFPEVENDPDLSQLWFGTNTLVSGGTPRSDDGLLSFADCIRAAASLLDVVERAATRQGDANGTFAREVPFKRYTILRIFDLLAREGKRAPNKEVAELASLILDEDVTANDVTQARKDIRKRNYRDE